MKIADEIYSRARKYRGWTAQNLSRLVSIPSISGKEKAVVDNLAQMLVDVGLDKVYTDGLGNLIGKIGDGPEILAIDAHIDTVDTGELSQWELDPFSGNIDDEKVYGRGAVDQKGGASAMITAARILNEIDYDGKYSIYFTFTIMEEDCDGMCWNFLIETGELVPDFVVITEPTNLKVNRGHRGRMEMDVIFSGISAHGAMPEYGDNAIYKASKAVLEIEKLNQRLTVDDFLGKGTIVVSRIESESPSLCAVPDKCSIHLDRRLTWGETKRAALAEVKSAVGNDAKVIIPTYQKQSYKGKVYSQEMYFPTWKIEDGHPLLLAGIRTAELVLGQSVKIGKWNFSTNGVATCGKHKIPTIGFGPGNEIYAHSPNEFVQIEHLVRASAFYALLPYVLP
ncbi:YgeY family selenium metabolism-linked hydrolase [bacterium]|nr:MAG: YgeY family selenium metabolism-linked hydrolase [bacterium]